MTKKPSTPELLIHSDPATRESNDRLYPLVVAGDEQAREQMITTNTALVISKVRVYLNSFPQYNHLRDDLISQGLTGLVTAVNKMVGTQVETPNPTGFISHYVHHAIGELLDLESGIRVPQRTFLRKKAGGHSLSVPAKEASLTAEDTFERDAQVDPRAVVDLFDEILGCCETDIERSIVHLRCEGRSDPEIAEILGLPTTTTWVMRRCIFERFQERNPEYARD